MKIFSSPNRTNGVLIVLAVGLALTRPAPAQCACSVEASDRSVFNEPQRGYEFKLDYERGLIGALRHTIQFGSNGAKIDYIKEGGQDILFPFERFTAEMLLKPRHEVIFLYQPLDLRTQALLRRDLIIDDLVFPAGTAVNFRYGFSFWRVSYLYDLAEESDREIAIGASFQIRNASIIFESLDGSLFCANQNIGPVPIFKVRTRFPLGNMWWGSEIDGFYADGKYITGSRNDFKGAIYDASLRFGARLHYVDPYLNLRFVGGGAQGTENNPQRPGDGYTDNWLHTFSVTLGWLIK